MAKSSPRIPVREYSAPTPPHQRPAQPVQIHGQRRAQPKPLPVRAHALACASGARPRQRFRRSARRPGTSASAPITLRMRQQLRYTGRGANSPPKVVSQITGSAALAAIKLTATNCEEPANTTPTKPAPPGRQPGADRQCAKITPNGAAPPASAWCRARPAKTPGPKAMFVLCKTRPLSCRHPLKKLE